MSNGTMLLRLVVAGGTFPSNGIGPPVMRLTIVLVLPALVKFAQPRVTLLRQGVAVFRPAGVAVPQLDVHRAVVDQRRQVPLGSRP
jgi:hypothetical protein